MIAVRCDIAENPGFSVQGGDNDVHMSVIEQVADNRASIWLGKLHVSTCLRGHILKLHFAEVAEDCVGLRVGPVSELGDVIKNVLASYEQILQAVGIKVSNCVGPAGHFQGRARQAAPASDIDEDAIAAVVEQGKSLQFSSRVPDVGQAVIVEIAKLSAHP